jgi:hypothetical protein
MASFLHIIPKKIDGAFVFSGGMIIDADGAKNAYNASNSGLDTNADAMNGNKYVGVVTINGKPFEMPDGSYVSPTSLQDHTKAITDPARYIDASAAPYLAACPEFLAMGVKLGDRAIVVYKNNSTGLILGDVSPHNHWCECSMAAGPAVGLSGSPRIGGVDSGCIYIVFPGTANSPPWPVSVVEFQQNAFDMFDARGGVAWLRSLGLVA